MNNYFYNLPINLIEKAQWNEDDHAYNSGQFRAWFDRSLKLWTVQALDVDGNQIGSVAYFNNKLDYQIEAQKSRREYGERQDNAEFKSEVDAPMTEALEHLRAARNALYKCTNSTKLDDREEFILDEMQDKIADLEDMHNARFYHS